MIALLVILSDQLTKVLILSGLTVGDIIPLTPFFNLVLTFNKGVSFSFLATDSPFMPWILSGFALLVCLGIGFWLRSEKDCLTRIALALILGGAIGNVIDRIRLGAVVDFLDFYIDRYHWPAFNVADSAICIGVVLILIRSFWKGKSR